MVYRYYADIGGWRFVVLIHKGRKWVGFVDYSNFTVYRRHVRELAELRPCDLKCQSLAKGMIRRRTLFKRCGVHFSRKAVQAAIDVLLEAGS